MDEAELAFVATMRDEATRQARAARAELDKLGGDTRSINVPVDVRTNVARAKAELKSLEAQIRKADLGMEIDPKVTKAARVRIADLKRELASLDTTATVDVRVKGSETLTEASRGVSNMMTAILVLGPSVLPILAGLTLAAGGLGAGLLAAAGAGGALGAAIVGQVKGMTDAQKAIATTQKKLDGLKRGSKEYRATLKDLRTQQDDFTATYGRAAKGLDRVKSGWQDFLKATAPKTLGVIGAALNTVADLLPRIAPLANAAAGGVRVLIGEFRRWARGPELAQILYFFKTQGPAMIVSWGHVAGNVLLGVLNLFRAFAPDMASITGGLEGMTAKFREWTAGLDQNQGFQDFLAYARTNLPLVGRFLGQLVGITVTLARAWAPFGGPILATVTGLLHLVNSLPTPVVQAFTLAIGTLLLMLKAWQVAVFANAAAERIATVATEGWAAAQKVASVALGTNAGRLGTMAVGLAGVAGAAQKGGGALSVLGGAASGAMAGAALGSFFPGPGTAIGGIIGGLGGLAAGLLTAGHSAKQSGNDARMSVGSWQDYAATLDQVTGATTRATRATALQELQAAKVLPKLNAYGVTTRQAVDAVVNGGKAADLLNGKLNGQQAGYDRTAASAQKYYQQLSSGDATRRKGDGDVTLAVLQGAKTRADAAKKEADAHRADGDAIRRQLGLATEGIAKGREELAVTRTFTKALKSLPRGVQVAVESKILRPGEIVSLVATYRKMQNIKAIRTLITENGGNPTQKQIERILARAKELAHTRAVAKLDAQNNASPKISQANRDLDHFNGRHATATMTVVRRIAGSVSKAATGFGLFPHDGGTIMRHALKRATGGTVPGSRKPYGDSVLTFLAPGEEVISNARGQADRYRPLLKAINADVLALGGTVGLARGGTAKGKGSKGKHPTPGQVAAAQKHAVTRGLPGAFEAKSVDQVTAAQSALNDRLDAYYKKRIKNAHAAAAASLAAKKSIADETAAIKANATARDAVLAKIQAAKDAGAAARDTALQQGDITSIESVNDAPMTAGFIVQGLQKRVAAQAAFTEQLAALQRKGVDKNLVADLRQKGVDAAGSYVSALAGATSEQLKAVNAAQVQIRAQAAKIGADTTAGLAVGLSSQLAQIDAAGVRLANALLKAVRRRLGIKSPSTEFASDGVNSVAGLIGALKAETPAAEAQAAALAARVQAAATPSLGHLVDLANSASRISSSPLARVVETIVIRHEVVSPDGSVSKLTAEQIAEILAGDPKAAAALERALGRARARRASNAITPSR